VVVRKLGNVDRIIVRDSCSSLSGTGGVLGGAGGADLLAALAAGTAVSASRYGSTAGSGSV
jgi:hypothetical protein